MKVLEQQFSIVIAKHLASSPAEQGHCAITILTVELFMLQCVGGVFISYSYNVRAFQNPSVTGLWFSKLCRISVKTVMFSSQWLLARVTSCHCKLLALGVKVHATTIDMPIELFSPWNSRLLDLHNPRKETV